MTKEYARGVIEHGDGSGQPTDYLFRIIEVVPETFEFSAGEDGDEVAFLDPETLKNSSKKVERRVYEHSQLASAYLI